MSSGAGWYSGILSKTVGPIYSAVTGVPDPWTKDALAQKQAEENLRAQGIDPATASADQWNAEKMVASAEIENAVATASGPCTSVKANDPVGGLLCSIQKAGVYVIIAVILLAGVYLYGKKLEGGG